MGGCLKRHVESAPKPFRFIAARNEIVDIPYDSGISALRMLDRLLALKQLEQEQYEPVGWSKCGGCGFNERCWAKAEAASDVALIPDVDQSLAKALHEIGVCTREELLAAFNVTSLSEFQTPGWHTAAEGWEEGRTDSPVCGCDGEAAGEDSCRTRDFPITKLRDVRPGRNAPTV